jgi:hypothetical protein
MIAVGTSEGRSGFVEADVVSRLVIVARKVICRL